MSLVNFICDLNSQPEAFPHFWEHTVGSGHATLALRSDWQKQLMRCHRELGFRHVRFHGLLSDDVGTFNEEKNEIIYSFFNANQICDFLLSADMKPFIELSFMPKALSSGQQTVFHYNANVTPPKDYTVWENLIKKLVQNWVTRYGLAEVNQWFFEVWNEPNLKTFWTGTQGDYFHLYDCTQRAIKSVHSSLKVGGPATAKNQWITEFLEFGEKTKCPIDFVSTHHYPTDAFGKPDDDTITQLALSHPSVLREQAEAVHQSSHEKPLYYTEWCTSSNPFDPLHDEPYAAAFIAKTIMEARNLVEGYSYWTFSDIFEENYFSSKPFHGGFGLLNIEGIPKPSYRAFQLLHQLGIEIFQIKGTHKTANAWVTRTGSVFKIMMTNWALPRHEINPEKITLKLSEISQIKGAYVERIDEIHANAPRRWIESGSAEILSPGEVADLEVASQLKKEPVLLQVEGSSAILEVLLPPQGTACITLESA